MKLPHKQSNLHCHHNQNKQNKTNKQNCSGKPGAYKRTRESNNENGRLCFRLCHNLSIEDKLVKPKPGSIILLQMENIPWRFRQGRKHEQKLEIVELRCAPLRSFPKQILQTLMRRRQTEEHESEGANKPATRNLKFPASARDETAFTQDQSFWIFLNAFKRLLLIMETSWHLVLSPRLGT